MDNKTVQTVTEELSKSLDSTQKNALNVDNLSKELISISCKENHDKVIEAILNLEKIDMAQKLELIHRENDKYELTQDRCVDRLIRMQDAQTQNVNSASSWWEENWCWVLMASAACITLATPEGRKLISSVMKDMAA